MKIEFTAPVRIESEMNRREHWTKRKKRFDEQFRAVYIAWVSQAKWPPRQRPWPTPYVVTLTRIGPRTLDDDNLAGGFKKVRDCIADILAVDDGDVKKVSWIYKQAKGKPREYGIRVEIESSDSRTQQGEK